MTKNLISLFKSLTRFKEDNLIIYEAIKEYGFKFFKKYNKAHKKKSGKLFHSKHYRLLVDRDKLIINKINKIQYFAQ